MTGGHKSTEKLKIALTADPELPVPPVLYGGIERVVDLLARGLEARGHSVTLFAHPDSHSDGMLVPWPGNSSNSIVATLMNASTLAGRVATGAFDIVHSFSRIAYLAPLLTTSIPKVMTYQRAVTPRSVKWGHILSRGTLSYTAISDWMMKDVRDLAQWDMIPNGVCTDTYEFSPCVPRDAPLVFLGRIEEIKGPHLAIDIAMKTKRSLVIAGNIPDYAQAWAQKHVLQHVDGKQIRYIGPVNDTQKNQLLGGSAAFLMPILWDEPFGIVMAEALACGTPVIGLRRGAVPEVVEDGESGFVVNSVDGLIEAISRIDQIDRRSCRERACRMYSGKAIVDAYEALYRRRVSKQTV